MNYIDGFVVAVPNENKEIYRRYAQESAAIFKQYGAISLVECWGDDVPEGQVTSFIKAVHCQSNETVVFAWISWPSKEVRDAGMKKVMEDPRMNQSANPMPFDGKRMIYGGFSILVNE